MAYYLMMDGHIRLKLKENYICRNMIFFKCTLCKSPLNLPK